MCGVRFRNLAHATLSINLPLPAATVKIRHVIHRPHIWLVSFRHGTAEDTWAEWAIESPRIHAESEFPTDVGADGTRDGKERSIEESLASRHGDHLGYSGGRKRLTCSPSELGSKWKLEEGAVQISIKTITWISDIEIRRTVTSEERPNLAI